MTTDVLADIFQSIQISTLTHFVMEMPERWGVAVASRHRALFILVSGAPCLLRRPGGTDLVLNDGDMVILPRAGESHWRSHADAELVTFEEAVRRAQLSGQHIAHVNSRRAGATVLTGAAFWTEDVIVHPVLAALPDTVHLKRDLPGMQRWIAPSLALMQDEIQAHQAGSSAVLRHLSNMLLVQAIRVFIASWPADAPVWLRGMADARLAPAVELMHASPEREWTLDVLAKEAGLSRTAFAVRFKSVTGESPVQYLTRWRMYVAARELRHSTRSMEAISELVGYESAAAFQKAFKRVMRIAPGEYRRLSPAARAASSSGPPPARPAR
ncbi:AraC family transcriptional regulator [Massilia arenosa]|uniref:AraC family transcriptional regulator n=1 Tax=Zemynaea arenosa TaxID=2561931 RepID=A0A4Y9S5L1_9BURK|nr:AraC family transcriptional regulator [Massilia arenosa]TFW16647.1 AraC family transcriptional regulator [Massilia arenosa]